MDPVVLAALEVLGGNLLEVIKDVWTKSKEFKPLLEQLESTLYRITQIFEDIRRLNKADGRPEAESKVLADQLMAGERLVRKCAGARWWNKSSYANKLMAYDRSLTRFFQIDVSAQILHTVRRVEGNLDRKERKQKEEPKAPEKPKEPERPVPAALVDIDVAEPTLDFLRNSPQFLALIPLLKENPRILKLTLLGLREKDPAIFGSIKKNKAEFFQLIYGPEADISKIIEDLKDVFEEDGEQEVTDAINVSRAEQETPHTISVILAEQEAIERLEEMGFDRDLVIEAFLACEGNEELAVNYLLENAGYFED